MKKTILTLATMLLLVGAADAQPASGNSGGGGGGGGGTTGGGRPTTGGGGGTSAGSTANVSNAGIDTGSLLGGFNTTGQGSRNNAVSPSNPFAAYYANPYAAGIAYNSTAVTFGSPVFGSISGGSGGNFSSGGGGGSGNRSSFGAAGGSGGNNSGGARNATSGLGTASAPGGGFTSLGNTGLGTTGGANRTGAGFGGTAGFSSGGGVSQLFTPPAPSGLKAGLLYSTTMRFKYNLPAAEEVRNELQSVVGRSTTLSVPAGVSVDMDSGVVVLRGTVADDDERRHVENLVRLSPGVRDVRNELTTR